MSEVVEVVVVHHDCTLTDGNKVVEVVVVDGSGSGRCYG